MKKCVKNIAIIAGFVATIGTMLVVACCIAGKRPPFLEHCYKTTE